MFLNAIKEGNYRSAEQHYVEAGDWKSAVHMYRGVDLWEDAHRVAQTQGGPNAAKQVSFYMVIFLKDPPKHCHKFYRLPFSGQKHLGENPE